MAASNYNWVCFDCCFATRHAKHTPHIPKCAKCKNDCYCLGYKVEVPKKTDSRAWRKLQLESRKRYQIGSMQENIHRVRRTHAIEKELARLEALKPNKDRKKHILKLKKELYG